MTFFPSLPKQEPPTWERHYTFGELARSWNVSKETVKRWCESEPDLLYFNGPPGPRRGKRPYVSIRVPESVARRVYDRHCRRGA